MMALVSPVLAHVDSHSLLGSDPRVLDLAH
jgi:hypothetical protein